MTSRTLTLLVTAFFAIIVGIVFQQIHTSMHEQGIASGGPYDNAAAYPRAVAIVIAGLVIVQILMEILSGHQEKIGLEPQALKRAVGLLFVFALYLGCLQWLGYHLTTTPMVFAVMYICGARQIGKMLLAAIVMSFGFAFVFERFLNVVLPGGIFRLNIPW
ncbi:MAG: tripartite tricarboxylate transporter TctB family protein [Roseibium sp.]|uniref:tripartite tricarboxylate transporter TctB family protein n=1 Tax=Roseibium sp. TaxID=1936156 RepID=UPI0026370142|nr:tripartite tricarboxylate transporter TctB family protein [Roseibium sp.]MCV0429278.1 tripartite tricarboxylate transporter TctB family protein [Roseibium sp.]